MFATAPQHVTHPENVSVTCRPPAPLLPSRCLQWAVHTKASQYFGFYCRLLFPADRAFPCPSARVGTLPLQLQRRRLKNQPILTASWRKKAKAHRKSICVHGWTALSRSGSMPNTCKELLRWRNGRRLARLCRNYLILKRRSLESALCSRIGGARLSGLQF